LEHPGYVADTFLTWKQTCLSTSASPVEALVERFLRPIESVFRGELLTPDSSFAVTIRTNLSGPPFGTFFDVSFDLPTVSDLKSPGSLVMRDEVESAITLLLLLDVVSRIAAQELPPKRGNSPDTLLSAKRKWDAVYPHLGELLLISEKPEKYKKMKVSLSRSGLGLSCYVVRSVDGVGRGAQERPSPHSQPSSWTSSSTLNSTSDKQPSMMEFIVAQASHDE
jgi:mediator of RNA polymerase II transcription subunit 17